MRANDLNCQFVENIFQLNEMISRIYASFSHIYTSIYIYNIYIYILYIYITPLPSQEAFTLRRSTLNSEARKNGANPSTHMYIYNIYIHTYICIHVLYTQMRMFSVYCFGLERQVILVQLFRGKARIWQSQMKRKELQRLLSGSLGCFRPLPFPSVTVSAQVLEAMPQVTGQKRNCKDSAIQTTKSFCGFVSFQSAFP